MRLCDEWRINNCRLRLTSICHRFAPIASLPPLRPPPSPPPFSLSPPPTPARCRFGLAIAHKITSGWRPELDPKVVEKFPNYCQLIEDCWEQKPNHRPSFPRILNYLLKLQGFVDIGRDREVFVDEAVSSGDGSSNSTGSITSSANSNMSGSMNNSLMGSPTGSFMRNGTLRGKPSMPSLRELRGAGSSSSDSESSTSSSRSHSSSSNNEGESSSNGGSSFRSEGRRTFTGSQHGSIREVENEDSET